MGGTPIICGTNQVNYMLEVIEISFTIELDRPLQAKLILWPFQHIFQGQHMIVDTDGSSCLTVNFGIGAGTTDTRQWDIMVREINKI